jgi:hypothetical protein
VSTPPGRPPSDPRSLIYKQSIVHRFPLQPSESGVNNEDENRRDLKEYLRPRRAVGPVVVFCPATPANVNHSFNAHFLGRKKDLPQFYEIVQHVTPVVHPAQTRLPNSVRASTTGGSMGRKPRVDRSPEEKWQIIQEGIKSGNVSETCRSVLSLEG